MMRTDRSLLKYILLSIITLGIYGMWVYSESITTLNIIAVKDERRTNDFLFANLILGVLTCGIYSLVWYHKMSNRVADELANRGIDYKFNASTFWLWNILGALIIVGPFVYTHKFLTSMNMLSEDYNKRGN